MASRFHIGQSRGEVHLPSSILSGLEPLNLWNLFAFLNYLLDLFVPVKFWGIWTCPLGLLCCIWNLLFWEQPIVKYLKDFNLFKIAIVTNTGLVLLAA